MDICSRAGNLDDIALGRELISAGKVGCIVLAGGDGSRLGWKGPKGTFPISPIEKKSLFQLLAQRVDRASKAFGKSLPIAVMTSPLNHEETERALPAHFDLFDQKMTPLFDLDGKQLEECRPNGNGDVLKCFFESGICELWRDLGVEYIQVIPIDNPLAEPFDPNQIGIHFKTGAEITLKAIEKRDPDERVGVIGYIGGKVRIVEYSENPPKEWNLGSTNLFCFKMSFIERAREFDLPKHRVKKVINGILRYKTETFIFDLLPHAERIEVILCERDTAFAPLKERSDINPVQHALRKLGENYL